MSGSEDIQVTGIFLWIPPMRYIVASSVIGWPHSQNDPWGQLVSWVKQFAFMLMMFQKGFCSHTELVGLDYVIDSWFLCYIRMNYQLAEILVWFFPLILFHFIL